MNEAVSIRLDNPQTQPTFLGRHCSPTADYSMVSLCRSHPQDTFPVREANSVCPRAVCMDFNKIDSFTVRRSHPPLTPSVLRVLSLEDDCPAVLVALSRQWRQVKRIFCPGGLAQLRQSASAPPPGPEGNSSKILSRQLSSTDSPPPNPSRCLGMATVSGWERLPGEIDSGIPPSVWEFPAEVRIPHSPSPGLISNVVESSRGDAALCVTQSRQHNSQVQ